MGLVDPLPREVAVVAAEVAVRRRLREDRPPQVEVAQDRRRAQVEVLAHELLDQLDRDGCSVPNVCTAIETGCATPIAYATCISQRSASPAATTFFAT